MPLLWYMLFLVLLVHVMGLGFGVKRPCRSDAYTVLSILFPRGHNLIPRFLYCRKLVATYLFPNALKQATFCSTAWNFCERNTMLTELFNGGKA